MSALRIQKKQQNFLIMDKSCLQEKRLSWGAKSLHAYLMSMKDDWRVQVENLQQRSTNGRDFVRGFLRELEKAGYIKKSLERNGSNGRFGGIEYLVLEVPDTQNHILPPATENLSSVPEPENPSTGNPAPEKATLISIKYNNYLNKQGANKTAAIIKRNSKAEESFDNLNSAAVSHYLMIEKTRRSKPGLSSVAICEEPNPLIEDSLTKPQQQRILKMIMSLNMPIKKSLNDEVEFCLVQNNSHPVKIILLKN